MNESYIHMIEKTEKRDRWLKRIQQSRRRYFYQRLTGLNRVRDPDFFQIAVWIKNDMLHSCKLIRNIIQQIRANGSLIQRNYSVSKMRQFWGMMYVAFRIKVYPANFIKYRLFKKENWNRVDEFVYAHTKSQRQFSEHICPEETDLFLNKFKFFKFCQQYNIKTPNVLAQYENGKCIYIGYEKSHLPKQDLFIKKQNGMMGKDAKKLSYKNGYYEDKEGTEYSEVEVLTYLKTYSKQNEAVLLQNAIKNHPLWMKYTSGALATCRIITHKSIHSSKINVLFCLLRMPHGLSDTDNYAGGGLAVSVNIENGILDTAVSVKPINGLLEFSYHPDTNQLITGTELPKWKKVFEFAQNLHRYAKSVFIGWDISLTEDGLSATEGSLVWSAGVIESTSNQPLYDTDYPVFYERTMENVPDLFT